MQPKPAPWLSPKVVTVKSCPKVLPAMFPSIGHMLKDDGF